MQDDPCQNNDDTVGLEVLIFLSVVILVKLM